MDVVFSFILLGAIIFFGFLASLIFERTHFPDIILLIFLGILIGPLAKVVDPAPLSSFIPFFAALALVIIMFSAGLAFNFYRVVVQLYQTAAFALVAYALTVVAVTGAAIAFGWNALHALFLAFVISDTCPTVANALAGKVRANEDTRVSLSMEALLTSTISAVLALSLLQFMASHTVDFSLTLNAIASSFSIAIVTGAVIGMAWLQGLNRLRGRPLSYLLTLGVVFVMYGAVEAVKGNGAIAALVFGMIIGNAKEVSGLLRWKTAIEPDAVIYRFQEEVAFFVRTFFFVYLGLVFQANVSPATIALSVAIVAGILVVRVIATKFLRQKNQPYILQVAFIPTGLASVVLAFLPMGAGIQIPGLVQVVLCIVILTNIVTAAAIYKHNSTQPKRPAGPERGEQRGREQGGQRETRARRPSIIGIR